KVILKQTTSISFDTLAAEFESRHRVIEESPSKILDAVICEKDGNAKHPFKSSSVHEEYKEERKEIMASIVNEMDELGEMALFTSAERGHIKVVKKLFPYTNEKRLCLKNRSSFDPFHIATRKGHKRLPCYSACHCQTEICLKREGKESACSGAQSADSLDLDGANRERTRLHLFQFSLRDQASNWLERLPAGSITTWEDLTT
ncbi:zinc finger, CCHC-type containing protein, partial [Tanacetum coccineum]